jgi:hypothetical protein
MNRLYRKAEQKIADMHFFGKPLKVNFRNSQLDRDVIFGSGFAEAKNFRSVDMYLGSNITLNEISQNLLNLS